MLNVYLICCGMDVHKSFLVACIASTNNQGVTTYASKRFSTFTCDLRRCAAWLAEHNCKDVCMESTGKYWIPIYNILEPTCKIVLAHPKYDYWNELVQAFLSPEYCDGNLAADCYHLSNGLMIITPDKWA